MRWNKPRGTLAGLAAVTLLIASAALAADQAPPAKAKDVKSCAVCHAPEDGQMRAIFDDVSMKSQVIQLKLDGATEVVKFDENKLAITNGSTPGDIEKSLRDIKKGHEVRVAYTEAPNGNQVHLGDFHQTENDRGGREKNQCRGCGKTCRGTREVHPD